MPTEPDLEAARKMSVGRGVIGLELHGSLQNRNGFAGACRHRGTHRKKRPEHEIIGIQVIRPLSSDTTNLGLAQVWFDRADQAHGDRVLNLENVVQPTVVTLSPDRHSCLGLDQSRRYPDPLVRLANAALDEIATPEVASNPREI